MNNLRILLIILLFLFVGKSSAQDVEHLFDRFEKKAFKFSGGISANQVLYTATGIDSRRSPYTYYLSGNLNVAFYGWNMPFTFSFSDQDPEYQTPPFQEFNRFGVAPYYKWFKLYAGYSSMTFSPYTLNGYTFLGVGTEISPGDNFYFSAMYGRLNKEMEEDTSENMAAVYKRMGYGFKIGYKKEGDFIDFVFFKAKDEVNSLKLPLIDSTITPAENLVLGVNVSKKITESIKLTASYANSAYTRDTRNQEVEDDVPYVYSKLNGLFTTRTSSNFYDALKGNIDYAGNGYGLGIGYERIDPGYQTMGAYYFNNDLENYTINANTSLYKNKVQLAVNFGLERNNLDDEKLSTMKKTVGAINVNYSPSPKWNIATSYSNFTTFTNIRSDFDLVNQVDPLMQLDTLDFTQLTQSANASISYLIGDPTNKERKQFLNLNSSAQFAANDQQNNENNGSEFYNGNMSYTISFVAQKMSVTAAISANYTEMPNAYNFMTGPMVSVSKMFFEKTLNSSFSAAWNRAYLNEEMLNEVYNFRLNTSYILKKKHMFNLSIVAVTKLDKNPEIDNFTEYTATFGYSYSFATNDEKKKKKKKKTEEDSEN